MLGVALVAVAFMNLDSSSLNVVFIAAGVLIAIIGFVGAYRINKIRNKRGLVDPNAPV
jgi:VIT1/CCC1 family predicted Fe2+/Mn2+ transporter